MIPSDDTGDPVGLHDPDTDLMLRVQADEPGAFENLVARYQHRLLAFLRQQVAGRDDAEELAQEVFLRVYRTRQRYQARSKFSTWLFAIANNLARNRRRGRKLVVVSYHQDAGLLGPRLIERLEQKREDPPWQRMQRQELVAVVRGAVNRLNARQRRALVLNKFEGMGYADIAQVMGLTPQAVKSLLLRARATLREALQGYLHTGQSPLAGVRAD